MAILLFISNLVKKTLKFIKKIILKILVFFTNYTIYFTGDSAKISLQSNSDSNKIIYILWGFIGFVLLSFFIFISFDFYIIQSFFTEKLLFFKIFKIFIPAIMVYNIYFLAYKTIHLPVNNPIKTVLLSVIKMVLISLILFFFTFPFLYMRNVNLVEKQIEVFRKNELIKNEYLINKNTKIEIKESFKENYISVSGTGQIKIIKEEIDYIVLDGNRLKNISELDESNTKFESYSAILLKKTNKSNFTLDSKWNSNLHKLKQQLIENEKLKREVRNIFSNSNLLMKRILLVYNLNHFKLNYILICLFFNLIFVLKMILFFLDENYVSLVKEEDSGVVKNKNFN